MFLKRCFLKQQHSEWAVVHFGSFNHKKNGLLASATLKRQSAALTCSPSYMLLWLCSQWHTNTYCFCSMQSVTVCTIQPEHTASLILNPIMQCTLHLKCSVRRYEPLELACLILVKLKWGCEGEMQSSFNLFSIDQKVLEIMSKPFLFLCIFLFLCLGICGKYLAARIIFKALMFAYKTTSGSAPLYLNSLLQTYMPSRSLRSASERRITVPSQRGTKSLSQTFSLIVPIWWNDRPNSIPAAESLHIFKKRLTTHLFHLSLTL